MKNDSLGTVLVTMRAWPWPGGEWGGYEWLGCEWGGCDVVRGGCDVVRV